MFEVEKLDREFEYRGYTICVWKIDDAFTAQATSNDSAFVYGAFGESVAEVVGTLRNRMDAWMAGCQEADDD